MDPKTTLIGIGHLPDEDINVMDGALALAKRARPDMALAPYRRHVDRLVEGARAYLNHDFGDGALKIEAVRQIISKRYGYGVVTDPKEKAGETNFADVIDRRRGGALALCILYVFVLKNMDQPTDILDFSARPLVRVLNQRRHVIIDPSQGGNIVLPHHLRRMDKNSGSPFALSSLTDRDALVRLQDHQKIYLLRHNAPEAALQALESALFIAPKNSRLWRELALLHARLDHIDQSISALKHLLSLPGTEEHRYDASQLLQQLQSRKS